MLWHRQNDVLTAKRYRIQEIPIYHFDLYRLQTQAELEDLGAEDYFYGRGICLVEWADRAEGLLPQQRRDVELEYLGGDKRRITVKHIVFRSAPSN